MNYLIFLNEGQPTDHRVGKQGFLSFNNEGKGRNKKEITDCTKAFLKLLYVSRITGGKGKLREKIVSPFDKELTPSPMFSKKTRGKKTHSTGKWTKGMKRKFIEATEGQKQEELLQNI